MPEGGGPRLIERRFLISVKCFAVLEEVLDADDLWDDLATLAPPSLICDLGLHCLLLSFEELALATVSRRFEVRTSSLT